MHAKHPPPDPARLLRLTRSSPTLLCCLVLLVLPILRAAPPSARPNILFAIADDQSFPHAGAYGCRWVKTPAFDRVAREGLLFLRAYTPNAKCAPSRACILTGRNSWQLKAACNHVPYWPAEFSSYVEALARHGYFVGKTGKPWAPGCPGEVNGRPRRLCGPGWDRRTAPPPAGGISPTDYAANFTDFLDAKPADQPFCFWYGGREPHRRYEWRSGIQKGGKKLSDVDRVPGFWPDVPTVRTDLLDYAFEIEHFDRHLGRMLAELERRGLLRNTLVVVTADNGMPFPRVKGQKYEPSNHLPLAIRWPAGIRHPGRKIADFVSFIDFAPTFLEVAGVAAADSGMQPITGRSLVPLFRAERGGQVDPARDHVLIGKERHDLGRPHDWGYPVRGIVEDHWLYRRNYEPTRWPAGNPETGYLNTDGSPTKTLILDWRRRGRDTHFWRLNFGKLPAEELYDLARDPDCLRNLAADPAHVAVRQRLAARMERELRAQGDPRLLGRPHYFENQPYCGKQRGYYERYLSGTIGKAGWVSPTDYETEPISE